MPIVSARDCRATHRGLPCVILVLLAVLALAPAGAVAQDDDATALLERAAETMAGLDSFHFELSTPRGRTLLLENIELVGLEGDVQRPDRFRASATGRAAIVELSVDVVGVGTRLWVTNPLGGAEQFEEIDLA